MTNTTEDQDLTGTRIDPSRIAMVLDVLAELDNLPIDHPDAIAVRIATANVYKAVKQRRRGERRDAKLTADRAVIAATATGAPGRIDDETQGIPLATPTDGPSAGTLLRAAGLLHLQDPLPRGRRVLPPAVPGLRRARTAPAATPAPT